MSQMTTTFCRTLPPKMGAPHGGHFDLSLGVWNRDETGYELSGGIEIFNLLTFCY